MAVAGRVAIVPKGDYDKNTTYKRLDCVKYYNIMYIAKKDVPIGIELTNDEYWMKGIENGDVSIDDTQVSTLTTYSSNKITALTNELNDNINAKLEDKLDKSNGDISETITSVVDIPNVRTLPTIGDKFKTIIGKIIKYFQDLKPVAFSGSYNDLNDKPTSMPANGGNSSTVNGHTVNTDVPSGAKFTDTNTWRGIQNSLTSDSTSDSLSAAQGKVLKNLVDGKAASNHTHSYLPLSGGTMTGAITGRDSQGSWISARDNAGFKNSAGSSGSYNPVISQLTTNGEWSIGNLSGEDSLTFSYTTNANYKKGSNSSTRIIIPANTNGTVALTDQIPSVGNGTVTITQNGTSKGTFSMNQSGDTTIALTDNNTVYTLPSATSSALGGVKVTSSSSVTNSNGLALAATEKNASISGTLANQINTLNNNLDGVGTQYWSGTKNDYAYKAANAWDNTSISVTVPAGTYAFTIKAAPCAKGVEYDAITLGISGINTTRVQKTFALAFGSGFYPVCTHTCVEKVKAGTYGLALWSSYARNINEAEIRALRIK